MSNNKYYCITLYLDDGKSIEKKLLHIYSYKDLTEENIVWHIFRDESNKNICLPFRIKEVV